MSQKPPDKLIFDLTPNDPNEDPALIKAVNETLAKLAAKHGIQLGEQGAIDQSAKENIARSDAIKADAGPKMDERTASVIFTRKSASIPVGSSHRDTSRNRAIKIAETRLEMSLNFNSLIALGHKLADIPTNCISLATKIGKSAVKAAKDYVKAMNDQ